MATQLDRFCLVRDTARGRQIAGPKKEGNIIYRIRVGGAGLLLVRAGLVGSAGIGSASWAATATPVHPTNSQHPDSLSLKVLSYQDTSTNPTPTTGTISGALIARATVVGTLDAPVTITSQSPFAGTGIALFDFFGEETITIHAALDAGPTTPITSLTGTGAHSLASLAPERSPTWIATASLGERPAPPPRRWAPASS